MYERERELPFAPRPIFTHVRSQPYRPNSAEQFIFFEPLQTAAPRLACKKNVLKEESPLIDPLIPSRPKKKGIPEKKIPTLLAQHYRELTAHEQRRQPHGSAGVCSCSSVGRLFHCRTRPTKGCLAHASRKRILIAQPLPCHHPSPSDVPGSRSALVRIGYTQNEYLFPA